MEILIFKIALRKTKKQKFGNISLPTKAVWVDLGSVSEVDVIPFDLTDDSPSV